MDIVKKNLISIVCGVVALLAVVAVLVPINGKFEELQGKVDQRKGVYDTLKGLDGKQRTLPVLSVTSTNPPAPLNQYPTKGAIEKAKEATDKLKAESGKMLAEAVRLNRRTTLVEGVLPQAATSLPQLNFRTEYQRTLQFMNGDVGSNSFVWTVLKAGLPPSEADIVRVREQTRAAIEQQLLKFGTDGQPLNGPEVALKITEEVAKVPDQLRSKSARESKLYISPDALDEFPGIITATGAPELRDIFFAQVGLWIQQDVAAGIAEANANTSSVLEAPIKHLVKIDIPDDPFLHGAPIAGGVDLGGGFNAPTEEGGGMDPGAGAVPGVIDPTVSILTKRKAGDLYDIATFRLVMNVDGSRIPQVLAALARNRFITVQEIQIQSVAPYTPLAQGYLYGPQPIVTLTLRCEQLFLREWLKPLMPPRVRATLGIAATP